MMRQMIKKGDPMLRLELPQNLLVQLQEQAKQNKRKIQDEVIKRLSAILNNEAVCTLQPFDSSITPTVKEHTVKFAQVVPCELKSRLEIMSQSSGLKLNDLITLKLTSTLKEPEAFGLNTMSAKILKHAFSHQAAINECKRNRQSWLHVYEREKLKLYLRFEKQLPRDTKESFMLLDVKAETIAIRAELESENKQDKN